jgi:hypothetical protein
MVADASAEVMCTFYTPILCMVFEQNNLKQVATDLETGNDKVFTESIVFAVYSNWVSEKS